jgi:hypothetical protein
LTNIADNGTVMSYKYAIEPGGNLESVFMGGSHNRLILLPSLSGSSLVLPKVYYSDVAPTPTTVLVQFQVNLAQQINVGGFNTNSSSVFVRGVFNGWSADNAMTNDPSILTTNQFGLINSNVYTMTYEITGSPGQTMDYKYYIDTGASWESPGATVGDPADNNNRFFNLADSGAQQQLPPVYFNEAPYAPVVNNDVTFQVDMTAQVQSGDFDPASGTVELRGNFNSWGTPQILCTNDPTAINTNLYKTVVHFMDGVNALEQYKFWASVPANSGWETMANNRAFNLANASSQTLPIVFFNDVNPSDLVSVDTLVTFSVNMAGAVGTDGHAFNPSSDQLFINGLPSGGFATWDTSLPQLTNNPAGSGIYSIEVLIPKGSPLQQTYKFGISDGVNPIDNEAAAGNNHVRYIRGVGTYSMPLDTFGNQLVEPSFGDLKCSQASPGYVLVSWLGRPGVHLQTRASLASGSWVDHLETDGLNSTNWPTSGDQNLFFRLTKP